MATKVSKKAEKEEKKVKAEPYFYAVGRRKSSVARVKVFIAEGESLENSVVNGRKLNVYFPTLGMQNSFAAPAKVAGVEKMRAEIAVQGGGKKGQLEASILGMARALVVSNSELKKTLKNAKLLTRDSRIVERKKPGFKKARKSPQWAKR